MKVRATRSISLILSFVLALGLSVCPVSAAYPEINISRFRQEKSQWCWAAAARMAADYLYSPVPTQSQIVAYIKGSSNVNEPGTTAETARSMEFATSWVKHAGSTTSGNPWTFQHVTISIDNHRPVVPLVNDGSSGHYYVICGYEASTERIALVDPGNATRYTCSWDDFNDGDTTGGWKESRPHAYTCFFLDWSSPSMKKGGSERK